jgi:hypothetical protein
VRLRQLVTAASTFVVAIVLAICVPVSQLQTVSTKTECCCPDPDHCKCPDHKPGDGSQPTMRACHKTQQTFMSPVLPEFVEPAVDVVRAPALVAVAVVFAHGEPHPAPAPRRPDAPS